MMTSHGCRDVKLHRNAFINDHARYEFLMMLRFFVFTVKMETNPYKCSYDCAIYASETEASTSHSCRCGMPGMHRMLLVYTPPARKPVDGFTWIDDSSLGITLIKVALNVRLDSFLGSNNFWRRNETAVPKNIYASSAVACAGGRIIVCDTFIGTP